MNRAVLITVAVAALVLVWAALYFPIEDSAPRAEPAPEEAPPPPPAAAPAQPVPPPRPAPAPQPPATTPPAAATTGAPTAPAAPHEMRPERMGPVDELKAAYESDARDSEAGAMEERIRGHLDGVANVSELVRKVTCVKTVCKLELRWTPALKETYMGAMMNLVARTSQKLAADPIGADEGQAVRPIDVYVSRIEPPYPLPVLKPAGEEP